MSFIGNVEQGKVYAPGWFLAHEECERKTRQFNQNNAEVETASNGSKYVPMGAFYPANDSSTVILIPPFIIVPPAKPGVCNILFFFPLH